MIRDIPEEHFDEAADLFHRRCLAFDDLELDSTDLRVIDARIRAHLDGLRLGGDFALEIARPALMEGSPEEAFVAVTLAFETGRPDAIADVEAALAADPTDAFEGIIWGLRLTRGPGTTAVLRRLLTSVDDPARAAALDALSFRRQDPGHVAHDAIRTGSFLMAEAGLRAARRLGIPDLSDSIEPFTEVEDLAPLALDALLTLAPERGLRRLREVVSSNAPGADFAIGRLAAAAGPADFTRVLAASRSEEHELARAGLLGLGHIGNPRGVPALIERLAAPRLGGVASIALRHMLGPELPDRELPPLPEDDEADWHPDDELPRLDPVPVGKWWAANRSRFTEDRRYRGGGAYGPGSPRSDSPLGYRRWEEIEWTLNGGRPPEGRAFTVSGAPRPTSRTRRRG